MDDNAAKDQNNWGGGVHVAAFLLALFTSWSPGVAGVPLSVHPAFVELKDAFGIMENAGASRRFR